MGKLRGECPRSDFIITFYGNTSEAYVALESGGIDLLYSYLASDQLQDAENNTNVVVAKGINTGIYEFDINNNYSISD